MQIWRKRKAVFDLAFIEWKKGKKDVKYELKKMYEIVYLDQTLAKFYWDFILILKANSIINIPK